MEKKMDLSDCQLSEKEREAILQVIQRDEDLRKKDEQKLHHLKNELYFLRKRGALRGDLDPETSCSRCRVELGRLLNRGATCVSCQSRVCKSCRVYDTSDDKWVCVICHKQMEIQAASGEWMNEFIRRPSRKRDNKVFVPPADVIKHSIRRSWTSADGFSRDIDTSGGVKETQSSRQSIAQLSSRQESANERLPNQRKLPRNPPLTQKMMDQTPVPRMPSQHNPPRMPSAVVRVPQPSITAPARPPVRKQQQQPQQQQQQLTPKHTSSEITSEVVVVSETSTQEDVRLSPSPKPRQPSPTPRVSRTLPNPPTQRNPSPSPRRKSPQVSRGLKVSESERSESQDSGYVTTPYSHVSVSPGQKHSSEMFDSGFDNQGSPITSRSSGASRQGSDRSADAKGGSPTGSEGSDDESTGVMFRKVMVRKKKDSSARMISKTSSVDGAVVLRSVDAGHRKTPTGSPVVKRIRRSQRESSQRGGGRLRSPDRFFGKENIPFNGVVEDDVEFVDNFDDMSMCLEFEEDLVHVTKCFDSDVLYGVNADKIVPESDDYKLVFISSSSSKSSGLNSLDENSLSDSSSPANSSPNGSVLDDDEVILFIDDEVDEDGNVIEESVKSTIKSTEPEVSGKCDDNITISQNVDAENPKTIVEISSSSAVSYQEIVESFSPTHSVDEMETVDHVIDKNNSHLVNILRVESPCGSYNRVVESSGRKISGQIVNRYFVRSEDSSKEKSVDEVSISNHSVLPCQIDNADLPDDDFTGQTEINSSRVLLRVSGWIEEDLCDPHLSYENIRRTSWEGDEQVNKNRRGSDVTLAVSLGGGDMSLLSPSGSRTWDCEDSADLVEVQSVHCTVEDDTISLGTFSEDGLSCQSTPEADVDVVSQLFTRKEDKLSDSLSEGVSSSKYFDNDVCDKKESEFVVVVDVDREEDGKEICGQSDEVLKNKNENTTSEGTQNNVEINSVKGEDYLNKSQENVDVVELGFNPESQDLKMESQSEVKLNPQSQDDDEVKIESNENDKIATTPTLSSSAREDRLESDSDSQDTVIEGESYKRMRQLAIQHKIIEANELINELEVTQETPHVPEEENSRSLDEGSEKNNNEMERDEDKCDGNLNGVEVDEETMINEVTFPQSEVVELDIDLTSIFSLPEVEEEFKLIDVNEEKLDQHLDLFTDRLSKEILEQAEMEVVTRNYVESLLSIDEDKMSVEDDEIRQEIQVGELSNETTKEESKENFSNDESQPEVEEERFQRSPSTLETYFMQSLGNDQMICSVENPDDNASSLETLSEVASEVATDQWDSDHTEKLDESVDDSDTTFSDSASSDEANFDREEELRGFSRTIDFSLHTIIEESCEESESERSKRKSKSPPSQRDPSDLEKYFSFTIGDSLLSLNGKRRSIAEDSEMSDSYSETSGSICSEGVDKMDEDIDPAILASSRLEKYFMTGFLGIDHYTPFDENAITDESGAEDVGSPSIRQKLSSKSKGMVSRDSVGSEMSSTSLDADGVQSNRSSSLSDEEETPFEKSDGCDTIKRKKKSLSVLREMRQDVDKGDVFKNEELVKEKDREDNSTCGIKESDLTPLPDGIVVDKNKMSTGLDRKQQSRDSGFIGSSDDLLKDTTDVDTKDELGAVFDVLNTDSEVDNKSLPETSKKRITREGSNSDDETRYIVGQLMDQITKGLAVRINGSPLLPRAKPPELEMFEAELTKLMQIVPGIDATVKEIVEELSSTDYYSDSYESSDYNSSEPEGPARLGIGLLRRSLRSSLRSNEELRLHCASLIPPQEGIMTKETPEVDNGGGGSGETEEGLREDANSPFTRETIYIYEKLMSSLGRMAEQASKENSDNEQHPGNQSPMSTRSQKSTTLQAVQHIRERLASLMREVHASSESSMSARVRRNNSSSSSSSWMGNRVEPRPVFQSTDMSVRNYGGSLHADITRWLAKQPFHSGDEQSISSTSSTNYESEDSPTDTEMSVESDEVSVSPALYKRNKDLKTKTTLSKLERSGSEITIVDDDLSFRSLDTPETLFATHEIGQEANKSKNERFLADASLRGLKTLPERGVLDLQYFVTQGTNNEYEVWQSLVVDEEKFKADNNGKNEEVRPLRARNLLGSLKSSSSDTLQCISEEDLDSKPSSTRTSMLGSSTNICSSQSSLIDCKRGSLEALGSTPERSAQSPSHSLGDVDVGKVAPIVLRKTSGFFTVDIPLTENRANERPSRHDYRSSLHAEVLESGEISHAKDKVDFRSSLHLWMENKTKPATRAMSADPLPQDYLFNTPNPLIRKSSPTSSRENLLVRPKTSVFNLSDNQLDKQSRQPPVVQYSTMTKSGPIGLLPEEPPTSTRKASTLPRIGGDLSANVSFLHKNSTDNFLTNASSTSTVGPQTQPKWTRGTTDATNRREVRSWSAEENAASEEKKEEKVQKGKNVGKSSSVAVPHISVSDVADVGGSSIQSNPSGRSSLGSQNNSDRESVPEEDIDRLVALHKTRSSLSSLGNRSDSMTSVYSAAGGGRYGTVVVRGEVLFGLSYNFKLGALEINIKNCRDLAPVDTKRNRSDPYVKVYLLPDKSKSGKRKTKVRKHTLNPTFDEVLRFFVTISELETRTLWLTVWHSDMFGRNDFLGEVMLPLGYDVLDDDPSPKWYLLQERLGPPEEVMTYKGELVLALKYVPPDVTTQKKGKQGKGSLHVLVKEARNLTAVRSNGTSDPFCKSYLLPDKSKGSKQKTQVVKKNCNPRWNHTFVYDDVSQEDLRDRCLELTVWDYDRLTSNDFLGGIRLSLGLGRYQGKEVDWLDSRGDEISLWQNMLDKPNVWTDGYVFLQPSMEKRLI